MKRLLLVDDDPDLLTSLSMLLEGRYEACLAHDGEEALMQLDAGFVPDAIVLDLMMPVRDGAATFAELKRRGVNVPVVLASAHFKVEERARELGADDFIVKPFTFDELDRKLRRLLGNTAEDGIGVTPPFPPKLT